MALDILAGSGSESGSESDEDLCKIEINHEFARRLEHNKRREALHRLQELKARGLASDSSDPDSDDSDSSEDDPDLEGISKKDLEFYDALVRVKNQDPVLHQKDCKLYSYDEDASEENPMSRKEKKEKPLYLKDVNARHLLENGPEFDDDVGEDDRTMKKSRLIYNKEQEEQIKAFLEAEKEAMGSDDDEEFMTLKERNGDKSEDENVGEIQKRLDEYFGEDGKLDENEMFLKSFFRDKMWVDEGKDKNPMFDDIGVSDDEDELEKQDKYEAEYNFRHEEAAGEDRVLGHSRVTEGSVRKKANSRKAQRKSKEERMAIAERERKEELKHLKNLKKKEIQEKLEKIKAIAGIGEDGACKINADDLEEDFDPEEYDKKMKEVFNSGYYDADDADPEFGSDAEGELEKPDFDKEDELLGQSKDWDAVGSHKGFAAARERMLKKKEEEEEEEEEEEGSKEKEGKRKRKHKLSLKEKVELEKELAEYYKLDYEDTIGDLKTRFKYKSVAPNRFGLSAEEILMSDDKNLNQFVSLKKLAPYRQDEWKVTYHQKLKKNLILDGRKSDGNKTDMKKGSKESSNRENDRKPEAQAASGEATVSKRSKRRRRQAELKLSQSRLAAYGKIPAKPHKKH